MTAKLPILLSLALLAGCGLQTPEPTDPPYLGTPTPVVTATPGTPGGGNLALFAKATGSSAAPVKNASGQTVDWLTPEMAIDGIVPLSSNLTGFLWRPEPSAAKPHWIQLRWNSHVVISSIQLKDSPETDAQVTKGAIAFLDETDESVSLDPVEFGVLPDDGSTAVSVSAPSTPVTSIKIVILESRGNVGLSEIAVFGSRVNEAIYDKDTPVNLTPYCRVTGYSGILGSANDPLTGKEYNSGKNRTFKLKDEESLSDSEWISSGDGEFAYVQLECDRAYSIAKVEVVDRTSCDYFRSYPSVCKGARFTEGAIKFGDETSKSVFTKLATDPMASVTFETPKVASRLRIDFLGGASYIGGDAAYAANIGIRELRILGFYKP